MKYFKTSRYQLLYVQLIIPLNYITTQHISALAIVQVLQFLGLNCGSRFDSQFERSLFFVYHSLRICGHLAKNSGNGNRRCSSKSVPTQKLYTKIHHNHIVEVDLNMNILQALIFYRIARAFPQQSKFTGYRCRFSSQNQSNENGISVYVHFHTPH